ncbi:hypothetical protein VTO42DRAFT_3127 [Malbranchea cinnamomea]
MEYKRSYPKDLREALTNKLLHTALDTLLKGGIPPLFVYNYLMIPSVLNYVLASSPSSTMDDSWNTVTPTSSLIVTQGTLLSHKLYKFGRVSALSTDPDRISFPAIVPCDDLDGDDAAAVFVDGMLIFGLTAEQRGLIHQFEADHGMPLENVHVEICLEDGELRTIDAAAFVWRGSMDGMEEYGRTSWDVDQFLRGRMYKEIAARLRRGKEADTG